MSATPSCLDRCQVDHKRWLLPKRVHLLVRPLGTLGRKCHLEIVDHLCEDDTHLGVGEAVKSGQRVCACTR